VIRVVDAGCAECGVEPGEPLITALEFGTVEAAKEHYDAQTWIPAGFRADRSPTGRIEWQPHPQGGEHIVHGQGSVWIMEETS
jgi:hypothetical protein